MQHEELYDILQAWSPIKVLKISRCSIAHFWFGTLLKDLEALEMNDLQTELVNSIIRTISLNAGRNLRRLSIAGCVHASLTAVLFIAVYLTSLEYLDVSRCPGLADVPLFMLENLRSTLRYLNVANSNVSADTVDALRLMMPNCEIVH